MCKICKTGLSRAAQRRPGCAIEMGSLQEATRRLFLGPDCSFMCLPQMLIEQNTVRCAFITNNYICLKSDVYNIQIQL